MLIHRCERLRCVETEPFGLLNDTLQRQVSVRFTDYDHLARICKSRQDRDKPTTFIVRHTNCKWHNGLETRYRINSGTHQSIIENRMIHLLDSTQSFVITFSGAKKYGVSQQDKTFL
ncbi:hypothetical protein TNCV_4044651 [Trichonephila clavipes]|nr:hypothetical protein TNCV_4044651 [Trichonephila clavipes]